jgi:hypothetical protein
MLVHPLGCPCGESRRDRSRYIFVQVCTLAPVIGEQRRDLLEIMHDRHGRGSDIAPANRRLNTGTNKAIGQPRAGRRFRSKTLHPLEAD